MTDIKRRREEIVRREDVQTKHKKKGRKGTRVWQLLLHNSWVCDSEWKVRSSQEYMN